MNPVITQRLHIGAIGALMILSLFAAYFFIGIEYPADYVFYKWFGVFYNLVFVGLLGVRLRQLIVQAIVVDPQPGIERSAVIAGQVLIALAFIGVFAALVMNFVGGGSRISQVSNASTIGFWVGLACIELVLANGRSAVLPANERPSGSVRFLVGLFLLFAGFLIGVVAVFGFLFLSFGH